MSSQPSAPIGQYADYLNVADVEPGLHDTIDDVIKRMGVEMSNRLSVTLEALMQSTAVTTVNTPDMSSYNYMEPVLTQNLRLTNITVPDIPAAPVAKRAALVMAVLETRRRFLEE